TRTTSTTRTTTTPTSMMIPSRLEVFRTAPRRADPVALARDRSPPRRTSFWPPCMPRGHHDTVSQIPASARHSAQQRRDGPEIVSKRHAGPEGVVRRRKVKVMRAACHQSFSLDENNMVAVPPVFDVFAIQSGESPLSARGERRHFDKHIWGLLGVK